MAIKNSNLNYTGLIPKYIGTAYDKVAAVADSIADVILVAGVIEDGTFQYIVDNMDIILKVVDDIAAFYTLYYGAYSVEPTTDPHGDPMDPGDLYYNTVENYLYVYSGTKWLPVGAIETTTEHIVVTADMLPSGVGTLGIIPLSNPYIIGQSNLLIHTKYVADGKKEYHWSTLTDQATGTYIEFDSTTLHFNAGVLAEGDEVIVVTGVEVATVQHYIEVFKELYYVAGPNEQLIKLPPSEDEPDGMTYVVGSHNLEVYLKNNQHSRELQVVGVDYVEVDPQYIQFINPLPDYSHVLFKKGHILSNIPQVPRTLMMDSKPTEILYQEGQFWYNTDTGRLSILYKDNDLYQWVDVSEEHHIITDDSDPIPPVPPVLINSTIFQKEYPDPTLFAEGTFWFNTATGELSILYIDVDTPQWIKTTTTA